MQNDMLKNTIAPWQEKGRWYHGLIDAVSGAYVTNNTDKFLIDNIEIATAYGMIGLRAKSGKSFNIIDVKIKSIDMLYTAVVQQTTAAYYYSDGRKITFIIPNSATRGQAEFWAFIL